MRPTLVALALFFAALPAHAAFTVYLDRSAWEAAVGNFVVDDFENASFVETLVPPTQPFYVKEGERSVESEWTVFRSDFWCSEGECHGIDLVTEGDGNHLLFGDIHDPDDAPTYNRLEFSPTTAFGTDIRSLEDGYWAARILGTWFSHNYGEDDPYDSQISLFDPPGFWGIVSDTPFDHVSFGHNYAGYSLDNVSLAVPEPSTVALLGFGLAGIAARRRRRMRG